MTDADFKELHTLGLGCTIKLTEERAIALRQLRAVAANIKRRCAHEGWADWKGNALAPERVALYDADK